MKQESLRWAFWLGLVVECGLVLLAWVLGAIVGVVPWADLDWSAWHFGLGVLATVPMVPIFLACDRWPIGPLRRIRAFIDEMLYPMLGGCSLFELALLSIAAGVGEEMLFRGVIQVALADWLGVGTGLVLTSVIFGLAHAVSLTYLLLATAIGLYLGWLYILSGNLLGPIVTHALYDFLALVYLLRIRPRATIEPMDQTPQEK